MKKTFLFLAFLFSSVALIAQSNPPKANTGTMTNTTPTYVTVTQQGTTAAKNVLYQVVVEKVSGTIGGTVFIDYSNDGVNYVKIPGTDSLALQNQTTNSKLWKLDHNAGYWVRARATGSGTGVGTVKFYIVPKY